MLSIDTVIVADAWLEFNGCVVGMIVLRLTYIGCANVFYEI